MAEEERAGEATEAPTPRRLQRAREAGQAPMSREVAPAAVLAAGVALLAGFGPDAARRAGGTLAALLGQAGALEPVTALRLAGVAGAFVVAPFLFAAALAGAAATLLQTGGLVHFGALRPDLGRLDPRRGLARLVSFDSLIEVGKALLKCAVAGAAAWWVLRGVLPVLPATLGATPVQLLGRTGGAVGRVLAAVLVAQAAIAAADVLRVRVGHFARLRMTRQELRDEHKESEGNPHVKARLRRLRMQRARRRMLAAVPKAAVVVTNPTHYAVALAYERGASGAPRVVAKGMDEVAARIREAARAHGVPLVANPPLARALHAVELDAEVPRELYQAVAELIAYVWRLRARVTR